MPKAGKDVCSQVHTDEQTGFKQLVSTRLACGLRYGAVIGSRGIFNFYRVQSRKNGPATVRRFAWIHHNSCAGTVGFVLRRAATAVVY